MASGFRPANAQQATGLLDVMKLATPEFMGFLGQKAQGYGQGLLDALMAPGNALAGQYDQYYDPSSGQTTYGRNGNPYAMMGDASNLSGMVTLGAGAVPRPAGALDMGVRLMGGGDAPPTDLGWTFKGVDQGFTTRGLTRNDNRALSKMQADDEYSVVELPPRSMYATQPTVNPDFMDAAKRAAKGDKYDLPAVVKKDGQFYVTDGHHRITAAAENGKPAVKVRLYDLDGTTQYDFPLLERR